MLLAVLGLVVGLDIIWALVDALLFLWWLHYHDPTKLESLQDQELGEVKVGLKKYFPFSYC
jgi:hypothetical protein